MDYFESWCNAPGCDARFYGRDYNDVEALLDKHFTRQHPERYHTLLDLPDIVMIREERPFPKSYDKAFAESMK